MLEIELDEEARARVAAWRAATQVYKPVGRSDLKKPFKGGYSLSYTAEQRAATNEYWRRVEAAMKNAPITKDEPAEWEEDELDWEHQSSESDNEGLSWMNKG